jgi:hypothetical protein
MTQVPRLTAPVVGYRAMKILTPSGGFNPLYQLGGPRSIQIGLKLAF